MGTSFLLTFTFLFFQTCSTSSIKIASNVTCIEKERQSLLLFKQSLIDGCNLLSTWSGIECCGWRGVGCDTRNGHVVKLDLRSPVFLNTPRDDCLGGELSHWLQNLKHLRYLDLSMNSFKGNIPEFLGSFEHLEYLNLSRSGFSGVVPHHLGNLSRLQYLDLRNVFVTDLHGFFGFGREPIVDELGWVSSLSSLRYLDLSGITIGKHIDWFHPVNMLPSLLTLNLLSCDINMPFTRFVNFTSLNSLDLSMNQLNSTIPTWLSNLTSLMHLNLYDNEFYGQIPDYVGKFSTLASIDLSSNFFETTMPDVLCNLSSLVRMDLSLNMFSGPLPANLGLLLRLEYLYVQANQLSGYIPTSLWQLSKLKALDLSKNSFVGVLSENHFTNVRYLDSLMLSSNSLALNISSRWIPPFQLLIFYASSCNIGPSFPNWLHTQTNLQRLDLSNSSIIDTIPEWFENNILPHILELDLSNNQISGKLPQFHLDTSSHIGNRYLKMNSNKFEGILATFPSNLYLLDLSDNLLSGHVPLTDGTMNPGLEFLILSKNRFTGSIPAHLCEVPRIRILDLSQNKFSGNLPACLGNLVGLLAIDLANNTLTGILPSSLGSLKELISLHLHNNIFEGGIPKSFQNLTNLVTMDLGNNLFTGTISFWIGEKLSKLKYLNLQSNKFTGEIPLQLCQLNALHYLNLAHNNITGMIPRCFGNLSGMITNQDNLEYTTAFYEENILASIKGRELLYTKTIQFLTSLDLSNNNIIEVPDVLMNLVGLKSLNLSSNHLRGPIPRAIGNLSQIESLDLSMNMLSGKIPQSLTSLNFLSYLNLSFNRLSGAIPLGNQLQSLADPSVYKGNDGLCGPPVSRSCRGNTSSYNHVGEDDDDNETLWFYSGMGFGFAAGFMGLAGCFYFIRTWRLSFFMVLDDVYGWLNMLTMLNLARIKRRFSSGQVHSSVYKEQISH